MVEVTGLEPAASASRTQRSTKLSHTSISCVRIILYDFKQQMSSLFLQNKTTTCSSCLAPPARIELTTNP